MTKTTILSIYLKYFYILILLLLLISLLILLNIEKINLNEYLGFIAFVLSLTFITQIFSENKYFSNKMKKVFFKISKNFLFISLLLFLSILVLKFYLLNITVFYLNNISLWLTIIIFSISLISFLHNVLVLLFIIILELQIVEDFKSWIKKLKKVSWKITIKDTKKVNKK